jgi:2-(3-amino-3-carboxypropyl)histidine synthase
MKIYTLEDLDEHYDLELNKVVDEIKKNKAELVLLQFPEGLKVYATAVVDFLREKTDTEFLIWLGSCWGACDFAVGLEHLRPKVDMLVQFGHNELMPSY